MYYSEFNGIFFIEGIPRNAKIIRDISTDINEFFGQSQLKSLDDIKLKMVNAVQVSGGNAVIDFKYGQRSSFWKSLFALDDVQWFATGKIAVVDPSQL